VLEGLLVVLVLNLTVVKAEPKKFKDIKLIKPTASRANIEYKHFIIIMDILVK